MPTEARGYTLDQRPIPWGNGCGHDPSNPNFTLTVKPLDNAPKLIKQFNEKLIDYYSHRRTMLPSLRAARINKSTGFPCQKSPRSDLIEGFIRFLIALVSRMDIVTLRVGRPVDGVFEPYALQQICFAANITIDRGNRFLQLASRAGILNVKRRAEQMPDGRFKGHNSIIVLKKSFFSAMGFAFKLSRVRKGYSKFRKKISIEKSMELGNSQMLLSGQLFKSRSRRKNISDTPSSERPDRNTWLRERLEMYRQYIPPDEYDEKQLIELAEKEYQAKYMTH